MFNTMFTQWTSLNAAVPATSANPGSQSYWNQITGTWQPSLQSALMESNGNLFPSLKLD